MDLQSRPNRVWLLSIRACANIAVVLFFLWVVPVVALEVYLRFRPTAYQIQQSIEKRIDHYQPTGHGIPAELQHLAVHDADLVGNWTRDLGRTRTHLEIAAIGSGCPDEFLVTFRIVGCGMGSYETRRFGTYRNAVLTLDKAVSERHGPTYEEMFTVRIGDQTVFLSRATAENILAARETGGGMIVESELTPPYVFVRQKAQRGKVSATNE